MPDVVATPEAVRAELQSILASPVFSLAERLRRFLEFIVERLLEGQEQELKEYTIGIAVFDRGADFIRGWIRLCASKPAPPTQAERYYETEGKNRRVRIELPKGAYVPTIATGPAAAALHVQTGGQPGGATV